MSKSMDRSYNAFKDLKPSSFIGDFSSLAAKTSIDFSTTNKMMQKNFKIWQEQATLTLSVRGENNKEMIAQQKEEKKKR